MKRILIPLFLLFSFSTFAQQVENVVAVLEGDKFAISYDLSGESAQLYEIKLSISRDQGGEFREVEQTTGDIGLTKVGDNKRVYWNKIEGSKYLDNDVMFQVEASLPLKEMPPSKTSDNVSVKLLNVSQDGGILTVSFIANINDDYYYKITPNFDYTFIVDESNYQIGPHQGNLGNAKIDSYKKITSGIPIRSSLLFKQVKPNSTTIPAIAITFVEKKLSGSSGQVQDVMSMSTGRNTRIKKIVFKNVPVNLVNGTGGEISKLINFNNGLEIVTNSTNLGEFQLEDQVIEIKKDTLIESKSASPKYYGLFIGIDNYQFSSVDLPNLDKPLKDATALQNVLVEKYSLTAENSTLLKNPTRADMLSALEELSQKVTAKDNLLVFYAGHGVWDERLNIGYWLPSDAKISSKGNWLSNSTIRDYIAGINTKHTLLITDACFSGSIFKTRGANADASGYAISKIYKLPSRKAMTSGTLTTVPDESKFMHYLVKRLEENTSKYLTTRQLFFSLETAVLNNTSTVPQLGVIQDTGDEGGDFIFITKE